MDRAAFLRGTTVLSVTLATLLAGAPPAAEAGTSIEQNPQVTFSTPGPHDVTLTACNSLGCSMITRTVTVLDPMPSITSALLSVATLETGQLLPVAGVASGQPPLTYTWQVFEGLVLVQQATGASAWMPTSDLAPGLYTVVLRVSNAAGAVQSLPLPLVVVAPRALDFYTVTPCRLLDTRFGSPLGTGIPKVYDLGGSCDIPPGARAIAVNVTVPVPPVQGNLSLYPGNYPSPGTSTINFVPGLTRANNAVLPLATDGTTRLAILASLPAGATVDVILDVTGYFAE